MCRHGCCARVSVILKHACPQHLISYNYEYLNDIYSCDIFKLMSQLGLNTLVHLDFVVRVHVKCHKLMHKFIAANPLVLHKHCHGVDVKNSLSFNLFLCSPHIV